MQRIPQCPDDGAVFSMRIIMFTEYSEFTHNYLRTCGNDVSRIDDVVDLGSTPTFICSHRRAMGGWEKGLCVTCNPKPGEFLDENGLWVSPNDFYEWHGGERVHGGF